VELFKETRGKGTVSDLVHYLWRKDELNKSYLFVYRNCQDFVNVVFHGTNAEGKKDALTPLCCQPVDSSIDIVYFDPRADLASSASKVMNYQITTEQLIATLSQEDEIIQQIDVYSCPFNFREKQAEHYRSRCGEQEHFGEDLQEKEAPQQCFHASFSTENFKGHRHFAGSSRFHLEEG